MLTFTWIEQVHATTESALISSMKVFGEFVLLKQKRHVLEAPRLDACIAALSWWLLGWGVAYGAVPQYGFIGQEQSRLGVGRNALQRKMDSRNPT